MRCPECGSETGAAASYCRKCGALIADAANVGEATVRFRLDGPATQPVEDSAVKVDRPALIVHSGGGQGGEAFNLDGETLLIGRSPDAAVFLNDVTVSRSHALLVRRHGGLYIDDLGSLNGTYVNRRRIESHHLAHGDEIQIGKYKLAYVER